MTNGTLDTRLKQELTQKFEIPCNIEYDRFSGFRIGGGNGIWLVHCPSGVKAYYATENNFDKKIPLNQENRGMKYAEIGNEGITKLYDNFFIFTEGTSADDKLIIMVSSQESAVEPILGNASGNIAQLDEVGGFSTNAINDMTRAVLGGVCPKCTSKFQQQIEISGDFTFATNLNAQGLKLYHFPLGKDTKIKDLNLKNDTLYRIRQIGHFDIGQSRRDTDGTQLWRYLISNEVNYKFQKIIGGATQQSYACAYGGAETFMVFNDDYSKVTFSTKGTLWLESDDIKSYITEVDNEQTFDLTYEQADSLNEVYSNTNNTKLNMTKIAYGGRPLNHFCFYNTAYSGTKIDYTNRFVKDVQQMTAAATTTSYFSIYQTAHLSIVKEIDSPDYINAPEGITNNFSNLYTSLKQPFYKVFDLWGQKVRHSNRNDVINNYEGTGLNINSNDIVVSGAILNQYDKFMIGWNVTNLYNPELKLTASAANCHSSIILEITEL